MKKFISWNVNGFRAILGKNFLEFFKEIDADIFCLQETKMQEGQVKIDLPGYHQFYHSAVKKGYSGTAIFSKEAPLKITKGIGIEEHDQEGRVLTAFFEKFILVNVYTPNAQDELKRLPYRLLWEEAFRNYLIELNKKLPVFVCGDLNVAHQEIDLKNPKANRFSPGFSDEERAEMTKLLNAHFIDTFRYFYPSLENKYTWWSYRGGARTRNVGWRIDYFLASENAKNALISAKIHDDILGSDHCPVELCIDEEKLSSAV